MDRGDDGDDDDGDSSRDDADDEHEDEEDGEEEEEHLALADSAVDPTETVLEIAPMTVGEVNTRVIELEELHEHDTLDLHAILEDAQDSRTRISQRVVV
nr:hypothetical protein [Tanacetum cinerariifolium]